MELSCLRELSLREPACITLMTVALALSACGGSSSSTPQAGTAQLSVSQAAASDIAVGAVKPGVTPFISSVYLTGPSLSNLTGIEFTITPKPGSVSKPVNVYYAYENLVNRGYLSVPDYILQVPVFGLYANYTNQVAMQMHFKDGSGQTFVLYVATPAYVDPTGIYDHPTIIVPRAAGSTLGFDFFVMKSGLGSPIVVDTDAEIRWVVPFTPTALSTAYKDGEFIIGDPNKPTLYRMQLDGTVAESTVAASNYTQFHHNIDPGNHGLFAEFDTKTGSIENIESTVAEISDEGTVLNQWDLAAILSAYMISHGDDASAFVRPGVDWFHNNATTYDASDDSIIVSSRENFVIKLDYKTGDIIWILGDPTKYWYTFPSLRAKALTLNAGGLYPVGQHAVSITPEGLLMLFNDGLGSANQPAGAPTGISRTYSAVSAYSIDEASMTAQDVWDFDYGQSIFSSICSSAYEALGQSILVDYATADNKTEARLVGLDADHNVVFDFQYPTVPCNTSWNALPIAFDNLTIN
jgi:arylsulfate sulfotransferase